jgi:hypothetical protein
MLGTLRDAVALIPGASHLEQRNPVLPASSAKNRVSDVCYHKRGALYVSVAFYPRFWMI